MGIEVFKTKDITHHVPVKFVKAFLPNAKKPYNLKAAQMPELDINGIASKAEIYNIHVDPKTIEEGLSAGIALIRYLVADGYKIKTPLFTLVIKIPGEYDGSEISISEGNCPKAKFRIAREFGKYISEKVKLEFFGKAQTDGFISSVMDEATGSESQTLTRGNLITIRGCGLKIDSDPKRESRVGVFFNPPSGKAIKASIVAVNQSRVLKAIVPQELKPGTAYTIMIGTLAPLKGGGSLLKELRSFVSDFSLVAQS